MRICILMGSPRLNGNTVTLLEPFIETLKEKGAEVDYITLHDKQIAPCVACYQCQDVFDGFGCPTKDDMYPIYDSVLKADCLVLATPIYSWYCTPSMKAALDRFFGMNKYYGKVEGPRLWDGMKFAIVGTHGYDIEYAMSPFEDGIKRLCEHSKLDYIGKIGVRDIDNKASFVTNEAVAVAREFADMVYTACL